MMGFGNLEHLQLVRCKEIGNQKGKHASATRGLLGV